MQSAIGTSARRVRSGRGLLAGTLIAVLVGVGLAGPSGAAAAAPANDLPDGGQFVAEQGALARDAAALAEQEGVSAAVIRERLRFQAAVDQMRESWPSAVREGSYAGGRMVHSRSAPGAVLYFKGAVPAGVRSQLAESGLTGVDLRGGQRFSWKELVARQNAAHDAVVELGFPGVFSTVDAETQRITVEVVAPAGRPSWQGPAALREEVATALTGQPTGGGPALRADELEIITRPAGSSVVELEHTYGGAGMRDDGTYECTSAFTVTDGSVDGVFTAAHCQGLNEIDENDTSGGVNRTYSAPFQVQHIGTYGDVEWHTTSHIEIAQFWSSDSYRRPVEGRIFSLFIDEGDYTCHYGRTSGYSCGYVSDANSTATFFWSGCGCTTTASNMVDVGGATSAGGDSGGPWFLGTTAYGIHHGIRTSNGDQVFTKVWHAELGLGVALLTQ